MRLNVWKLKDLFSNENLKNCLKVTTMDILFISQIPKIFCKIIDWMSLCAVGVFHCSGNKQIRPCDDNAII